MKTVQPAQLQKNNINKIKKTIYSFTVFFIFINLFYAYSDVNSSNGNWPIYRGDESLSGIAKGNLSKNIKLLKTYKIDGQIKSSPVIYNNIIYIGSINHFIYAIHMDSGEIKWSFETDDEIEAPPFYAKDIIFVSSISGVLYALSANKGTLMWKFKADDRILGSANLIQSNNKSYVLIGSYDTSLYALDINTGNPVWTYKTDNYINGTPSVFDNMVIFGGCDAKCHIISGINGELIASIDLNAYIAGSAPVRNNIAVIGNYQGELLAVNITDKKILWNFSHENTGPFIGSAAFTDKMVVAASRDKYIYCLKADNGELIWKYKADSSIESSPVICNDKVIFASKDGWVYILKLSDGTVIMSYEIGGEILGSPAISNGKIIIGSLDGKIYIFGEKA